ncbi:MAG: hypothetical protein C0623_07015 [Desulfuromonas sp.]|nr:MAG: hypothetical protein C0623_07015 [Desulfuromonas sp.]
MGIAYLVMFVVYIFVSIVIIVAVKKIFKRRWLTWLTVAIVLLFPTYDIIIQLSLLKYYELTRQPLQQISRTVDAPGSLYWEDNVWPGYSENYRLWMIDHLLDGEHLDTLAMNGPDGKIYLYRYGKGDIPEIFNESSALPKLNYHVSLDPVSLWFWQKPFVWADRIEISDMHTNELIAFSERYMGYSPRILVIKAVGGEPFEGGGFSGDRFVYDLDNKTLFKTKNIDIAPELKRSYFSRDGVKLRINRYIDRRK